MEVAEMPTFQVLSAAEARELAKRRNAASVLTRAQVLEPYRDALRHVEFGEGVRIELAADDKLRAVKRRFTEAAHSLGLAIKYKPGEDQSVVHAILVGPYEPPAKNGSVEAAVAPV